MWLLHGDADEWAFLAMSATANVKLVSLSLVLNNLCLHFSLVSKLTSEQAVLAPVTDFKAHFCTSCACTPDSGAVAAK